ncbi:MAG: hypothetical protein MI757_00045 [Pirellulales bacterium]|nr:hypothetical protein [Pirellulales bacterium]
MLLEVEEFVEELRRIEERFEHATLHEPLRKCAQQLRLSFISNFARKENADGTKWPERKPRMDDDGHPLLIDEGDLLQATTREAGRGHVEDIHDRELVIGVDADEIEYSVTQQEGSRKKNIPQRQYVYARDKHLGNCGEILADAGAKII